MKWDARPGTYALMLKVQHGFTARAGGLGFINFKPGYYAYAGSAFGPGGLRARLAHHLSPPRKSHWHIDYLRREAEICQVWFTYDPVKREHAWAEVFKMMPGSVILFPGFGASDCKCATHLFQFTTLPNVDKFIEYLRERYPYDDDITSLERRDFGDSYA
jgi:Uri superfamily endonuclease